MIILGLSEELSRQRSRIFDAHTSVFVRKYLTKLPKVDRVIGVMATYRAETLMKASSRHINFNRGQGSDKEIKQMLEYSDDMLPKTALVLKADDQLLKNQLVDVGELKWF